MSVGRRGSASNGLVSGTTGGPEQKLYSARLISLGAPSLRTRLARLGHAGARRVQRGRLKGSVSRPELPKDRARKIGAIVRWTCGLSIHQSWWMCEEKERRLRPVEEKGAAGEVTGTEVLVSLSCFTQGKVR